ncbi:acetyl-CoA carboxylase biotin carboxyl carrier protein [Macrococcus armenti]|uniref:Biotin carboxyl carrier protein of acetyl-CoA carboxylase n=1 Tax=Macrococcus armenti TaxID=2875764 RepID=A0ABY3ZS38_9STAP|nr:acetyl-CoA carboxylase biotin carboxyl carrier protein [Macrococcus armenti]UOB19714.1 acetyl-CoA carboxylase biotin carboxyl carrier protein [Macrococcus armenti]
MNLDQIKALVEMIDASNLTELNYEDKDLKLKLKKETIVQQASVPVQEIKEVTTPVIQQKAHETSDVTESGLTINAPMVGTFYKSPSPEADPYVKVGDKVSNDSIVCILEAMKLFNEIQAEVSGEIVEILVEDGQMVEYGQPLFKVK